MDDGFDVQTLDGQPVVNGLFVRSVEAMDGTFKDVDEGRREVLVEFPHERVDTYKTTFGRDCFRESFDKRMPVMCWQHDLREPIGRATSAQVTPRANELVGKLDDFDSVPLARRAFTQIQSGTLTDFSFGFRDPLYEPHPQHRGVRRIKRATMKEFSPVTVGSIPGAIATGTREEDLMEEHSAEEIRGLVEAKLITEEEGKRLLAEIPFYREHIKITSVPDVSIEDALAVLQRAGLNVSATPAGAQDEERDDEDERINAATIVAKLPEEWQRQMAEADAKVYLVLGDEEWGPIGESRAMDEAASELLAQVDAACRSASEWLEGVDETQLSDEVRQAIGLYRAAGNAADALMEASNERADDMVTCPTCGGSGKIRDGHVTCPTCHGNGKVTPAVAAENREEDVKAEDRAYWLDENYLRFVSVDERKKMADSGVAMPNGDFPIPDKGHLSSALGHFSSYTGDKAAAAAHIKKRAKALGVELAPDALSTRATKTKTAPDAEDEEDMTDMGVDESSEDESDTEDEDEMAAKAMKRLDRHAARS